MAWVNENIIALLAVIIAAGGLVAPLVTALIQRNTARSNRFTRAIEHLSDDLLSIRMGALFELKKLGLESKRYQADIVQVLSLFIREHLEHEQFLRQPRYYEDKLRPNRDVFFACEIAALFYEKTKSRVGLSYLNAVDLDLLRFH